MNAFFSTSQFLFATASLLLLWLTTRWLKNFLIGLGGISSEGTHKIRQYYFFVRLGLGLIWIVAFILLNPLIHVILTGIILVVGFPFLNNNYRRHLLEKSIGLEIGRRYLLDGQEMVLTAKSTDGLIFSVKNQQVFMPYRKITRTDIRKITADSPVYLSLSLKDESDKLSGQAERIQKALFGRPYIFTPVEVNTQDAGNGIELRFGMEHDRYLPCLKEILSVEKFEFIKVEYH